MPDPNGLVSIQVDGADLQTLLAEYAQENANLRLMQKALIRRANTLEARLAVLEKPIEKPIERKRS